MKNSLLSFLLLAGGLTLAETAGAQTQAFVQWPLLVDASDNAAVRSANVTPGAPTLRRFVLSNGLVPAGTTVAYPAYSAAGQAFAPVADGGGWSTTISTTYPNPGTGGSPRRRFYEQFTVAATGAAVRVDSVLLNLIVPNSAAGRLAVAWSRSNFVSDSASVTGGKGPGGALAAAANGSFGVNAAGNAGEIANNPAVVPQLPSTGSSPDQFRFALNGATGVELAAGQTLTVRLYVAVGSSSAGRYALLRNVTLKSLQALQAPLASRSAAQTNLAVYPNPAQGRVVVPHTAASRDARVTVFSATGAKVAAFAALPGTSETAVDFASLAKGLYLVEYADGAQRSSARIVKE